MKHEMHPMKQQIRARSSSITGQKHRKGTNGMNKYQTVGAASARALRVRGDARKN